tara:strand:- start:12897 stop:13022 length:126 start_codon:yes stop_codon:yes gene_type:complete
MPNVNGQKFPYTKAGMKAANQAKKKTKKKPANKVKSGATYE